MDVDLVRANTMAKRRIRLSELRILSCLSSLAVSLSRESEKATKLKTSER